ncbi:aa3-type cytochrome c oxidase subunit IV [Devosia submarina]|uniref:aa3-type cytochrome c oxidase subunit IV n=1 Tax=Devosia submarina TaxID=1173082 RepID=UPI000D36E7BE|nr:aa3-type cytochrome c oxidase subunit IV [Devosia submarina]
MAHTNQAEHHAEPVQESPMDYAQHERTYRGFLTGVKWTAISMAVLIVILYFLVQP